METVPKIRTSIFFLKQNSTNCLKKTLVAEDVFCQNYFKNLISFLLTQQKNFPKEKQYSACYVVYIGRWAKKTQMHIFHLIQQNYWVMLNQYRFLLETRRLVTEKITLLKQFPVLRKLIKINPSKFFGRKVLIRWRFFGYISDVLCR